MTSQQENINIIKSLSDTIVQLQKENSKLEDVKNHKGECCVCYDNVDYNNRCCLPKCDHVMCKSCFYEWLDNKSKNSCPMCRDKIFKKSKYHQDVEKLQQQALELEDQIAENYEQRRRISRDLKSLRSAKHEFKEHLSELGNKYVSLRNKYRREKEELNIYRKKPWEWKKTVEKREQRDIQLGKKEWRKNISMVHDQLYDVNKNTELYDDDNDMSLSNMFELPPDFAGHETRKTIGTYTTYNNGTSSSNRVVLEEGEIDEIPNDYYDYDTDETDLSMPELIDNEFLDENLFDVYEFEPISPPPITRNTTTSI